MQTAAKNQKISDLGKLTEKINSIVLDKEEQVHLCLVSILSGGHVLLEGAPGMGKTSLVKCIVKLLGLSNQRIQFTNDMLPADILGSSVFKQDSGFEFHRGPIFANLILADEINRATPKTQSALLQAMEEKQVNIDGETYNLDRPFFVFATQNPEESIGTFPLPESQLDRFFMRIEVGLPSREGERNLLTQRSKQMDIEDLGPVLGEDELRAYMAAVESIHCSDTIIDYVLDIVQKSRSLAQGLSPRGSQELLRAAKASALIEGRDFVIPEDVQRVATAVMNHRIGLDSSGQHSKGTELAEEIVRSIVIA